MATYVIVSVVSPGNDSVVLLAVHRACLGLQVGGTNVVIGSGSVRDSAEASLLANTHPVKKSFLIQLFS